MSNDTAIHLPRDESWTMLEPHHLQVQMHQQNEELESPNLIMQSVGHYPSWVQSKCNGNRFNCRTFYATIWGAINPNKTKSHTTSYSTRNYRSHNAKLLFNSCSVWQRRDRQDGMLTQNTLNESRVRRIIPVDSHKLSQIHIVEPEEPLSASKTELSHRWPFLTAWFVAPSNGGCHPSQVLAHLFGLPCKLGLKSRHINVHLLQGSTSQHQAKSNSSPTKSMSNARKWQKKACKGVQHYFWFLMPDWKIPMCETAEWDICLAIAQLRPQWMMES